MDVPPRQHAVMVHQDLPDVEYGHVKCLLSEAEMQAQQSQLHLDNAESALLAAQSQHAAAKLAHDETVGKVEALKAQFRRQIMEEGLRQPCRWNDMYRKLVQWKGEHDGDTTVPCEANSDEEVKRLNRWVINQRSAYKYFMNGDKKHIKDHRIDALNKIGFVWSITDQLWDRNFDELQRHHAETGSFEVPVKQNKKLSTFISRLRTAMKHREEGLIQSELTEERIDRLNSIGFAWGFKRKQRKSATRDTVKFDVMYRHLVSFKEEYGHTMVNKLEKEWKAGIGVPGKKVYRRLPLFLAFARKEKLKFDEGQPSSLDGEKIRMLSQLGVEWKRPACEPRKNSGGEASRKKKKKAVVAQAEVEVTPVEATNNDVKFYQHWREEQNQLQNHLQQQQNHLQQRQQGEILGGLAPTGGYAELPPISVPKREHVV